MRLVYAASAMGRTGNRACSWRSVSMALVALVLLIRFMVPSGYMVDARAPSHGLVICTGHGPFRLPGHGGSKAPAHKSADAVCAFAGAATPAEPPVLADIVPLSAIAIDPPISALPRDLAPGRGFAAPPPPSRAPPSLSS